MGSELLQHRWKNRVLIQRASSSDLNSVSLSSGALIKSSPKKKAPLRIGSNRNGLSLKGWVEEARRRQSNSIDLNSVSLESKCHGEAKPGLLDPIAVADYNHYRHRSNKFLSLTFTTFVFLMVLMCETSDPRDSPGPASIWEVSQNGAVSTLGDGPSEP